MKTLFTILPFLIVFLLSCSKSDSQMVFEEYINSDWKLKSSATVNEAGDKITSQQIAFNDWYDVNIPATVMAGLRQNGLYPDIYFSNNIDTISIQPFKSSWWYVKEFSIADWNKDEFYSLKFEGINYQANIWLNGYQIATSDIIEGPFRIIDLDITKYVSAKNILAVEVIPPKPTSLTIGFVDWNPNAPDNNMGLWRGVKLKRSGKVSIENVAISSDLNVTDLSEADLTLDVELKNHSSEEVSGSFSAKVDNDINFEVPYTLLPNETKRFILDKNTNPELHIINPRVWWPSNMGNPELYTADFSLFTDGKLSHAKSERFGIRKISDYTFKIGNITHRGYTINGKKLLLKGGGWVDDLLLADTDEKVRAQVDYVKDMNMNLIRLEGFWGNSKALYDACEENGILLMIGLSCQWEWTSYCNRPENDFMCVVDEHDINMVTQSFQDQVKWGMNNPSIFVWVFGSDKLPIPALETSLIDAIRDYDKERTLLSSCQNVLSEVSGPSGTKMFGPYEYVSPIYWYIDTKNGGAYGFNTETGPGAQIPPIESLKKMMKPEDLPLVNEEGWQFHSGRNEFQNLDKFLHNYENRYWKETDVEDFAFNVQMSNYEAVRAMFEAFVVNRNSGATGVVQWMLNSAWPEMVWQLYDWYLNPNGAYFGTKTANQPVNLIYNYGDKNIYLSNITLKDSSVVAHIQLFDIESNKIVEKMIPLTAEAEDVKTVFSLADITAPSDVYFLSMRLTEAGNPEKVVANSFYWLSAKEDKPDFENTEWYYTPNKEFSSFSQLRELEKVEISSDWSITSKDDKKVASVTLTNKSDKVAFFIEMRVIDREGQTVLPVIWSDNYVSLLPNESKTFEAVVDSKVANEDISIAYKGFNVK
ncbi:MAG: glycoside hydrolase family 2 [Parabacteroides sp.]|nr:glycoside hydrolase family 2 [Parabacteroides sp.]